MPPKKPKYKLAYHVSASAPSSSHVRQRTVNYSSSSTGVKSQAAYVETAPSPKKRRKKDLDDDNLVIIPDPPPIPQFSVEDEDALLDLADADFFLDNDDDENPNAEKGSVSLFFVFSLVC
jgi:hypothetical protein